MVVSIVLSVCLSHTLHKLLLLYIIPSRNKTSTVCFCVICRMFCHPVTRREFNYFGPINLILIASSVSLSHSPPIGNLIKHSPGNIRRVQGFAP